MKHLDSNIEGPLSLRKLTRDLLKTNERLVNRGLTSLIKEATDKRVYIVDE